MNKNKIKHAGVVEAIVPNKVRVRILQSSACSGCKVAAHCNASETKEKIIDVYDEHADQYHQGDRVVVATDTAVGFRASLYAYVLPLVVMVATLVVVMNVAHSEGLAALLAIGVLIPYYLVVYLLRDKLSQKLSFEIIK